MKEKLFPDYHGTVLTVDGETIHTIPEESDISEIEEESDTEQVDPEDTMARDRYVTQSCWYLIHLVTELD